MSKVSKDLYLQLYSTSPAPKRDYHGLTITKDYITLNSWDISHGPHVFPKKMRTPISELQDDVLLQNDIRNVFGIHVLEYAMQISKGNASLYTLPHQIFLRLLRGLAANDIIHLGQTSKIFFELCNTNPVWKILYRKRTKRPLTNHELTMGEKQTWKYLLKKKLTERISNIIIPKMPKPNKETQEQIERYSKPIIHKKRQPPTEKVPKIEPTDLDLKGQKSEKEKFKSKSLFTLPSTEAMKKAVRMKQEMERTRNTLSSASLTKFEKTPRMVSSPILAQKMKSESELHHVSSMPPKPVKKVKTAAAAMGDKKSSQVAPKKTKVPH